ncbi:MAG: YggS family pyridoxal phosphate-dependent enzyme [Gemmatimonadota bacterium]|jgi:pyridoxal phosphate enzyme (YggS family)
MYQSRLRENLPRVREAISIAAGKSGRDPGEVTLVAITKAHPLEALEAALACGIQDLGENRVGELREKVGLLGRSAANWHMVGHVQSRKARPAAEVSDLIHSVDSLKLARKISAFGVESGRSIPVLLQVNLSGEETKSGFTPEAAVETVHETLELEGLDVRGLMTMAPFTDHERVLRSTFRGLREIQERAEAIPGYDGRELSMGMTNDFELAVEEGSTMVRIGTALFGERPR